jgi:hypothetical protein
MKKSVITITVLATLLLACKSKISNVDPSINETYFPLNVGNQWVYQNTEIYKVDTLTVEHDKGMDTVVVKKDTTLNGKLYSKLVHTNPFISSVKIELLRDSSGYLVNEKGIVLFSPNFLNHDTIYSYNLSSDSLIFAGWKNVMINSNVDIIVPAGNFSTNGYEVISYNGRTNNERPRILYAKNVGIVLYEAKYLSTDIVNFRNKLISYKIK